VKKPSNVEIFRQKLENLKEHHEGDSLLGAIAEALLRDYNSLFPTEIYKYPNIGMKMIKDLIPRYCYMNADQCPICGAENMERQGRRGPFLGCTNYPECKGAKDISGKVSVNEALKSYLSAKLEEEKNPAEKKKGGKRWQRLSRTSKGSST